MVQKSIATVPKKLGTFTGVFVPSFLSIIGVILYLRLGYIVGTGGLIPTLLIILLASSITFATGLAVSAITTTIRIGAGGAYSIISKTLGLEIGGSVGIPLALAQILSMVIYIIGFSETWIFIFPEHSYVLVSNIVLGLLVLLTLFNLSIAITAQVVVFGFIILSLISVFIGGDLWWTHLLSNSDSLSISNPQFKNYWPLFALFFPAVTGLMAGIGLSGELSDPKKQIPRGVISASIITTIIYILTAFWYQASTTNKELTENSLIIIEKSLFALPVIIGILSATFSSALTTLLAAPRLIQALAEVSILPFSKFFASKSTKNIPKNAIIFTVILATIILNIGSLNDIAPFLTMFFLISYAIINLAVFTELALGLVSFRPTIKIYKIIPFYGFVSCILTMFLINTVAGFLSITFLFLIYLWLVERKIKAKEGDVRSGLFVSIAEWAAKKVLTLPESTKHTWKPNILVPVVITRTLLGNFPLIKAIAFPNGTMTVLGVNLKHSKSAPEATDITRQKMHTDLAELANVVNKFDNEGIFTSSSVIDVENYTRGICISLAAIEGQVFHPNVLFLPFKADRLPRSAMTKIFKTAQNNEVGVIVFDRDKDIGLGSEEDIHVWLGKEILDNDFYEDRKCDLVLLTAYKLYQNWNGKLTIHFCTLKKYKDRAKYYLHKLAYEARLPTTTKLRTHIGNIKSCINDAPQGDIHLIPIDTNQINFVLKLSKTERKSFLFILDSTKEDILA